MALLKKLRGKHARRERQTAARGQMAMLRRLPKILRFIPGTAQDVRAYFLTLQYWLAGSEENIANMVACWWTATPMARARACAGRSRSRRRASIPEIGALPSAARRSA